MNKQLSVRPKVAAVAELYGGRPVYYDKPNALQVEIDLRMNDDEIMTQLRELVERTKSNRKNIIPF